MEFRHLLTRLKRSARATRWYSRYARISWNYGFLARSLTPKPRTAFANCFVIGNIKTGTTSCHHFLRQCGLRHLTMNRYVNSLHQAGQLEKLRKITRYINSFDDLPWNRLDVVEMFMREDRDHRFILTVRDPDAWFDSYVYHNALRGHPVPTEAERERFIAERYEHHNRTCRELARQFGKKLLEIDVTADPDAARKIAEFLELDCDPLPAFPHRNLGVARSAAAKSGARKAKSRPIKVAYGSVPKDGGTFTFYRNLRPALLARGIDMRCVSVGFAQVSLRDERFVDSGCVTVSPRGRTPGRIARKFADWCEAEAVDIVIGVNSAPILSALPHLPERIRVIARCANAFDHGYRITMAGRERLARIVALSPRLRDDLVGQYGADPDKVTLIPNGIDPAPFEAAAAVPRGTGEVLRMGFLGRLEHNQKGVLHLPAIVRELGERGVAFHLRIAGEGRHEWRLRRELAAEVKAGRVSFAGRIAHNEVPQFLAGCDVFAFTSQFEGVPNALLEAMMAGCAPVSFTIEGITDFVIEDGKTGLLAPQGDAARFADCVAALAADRARLAAMAQAAALAARERFSAERCADAYAAEFRRAMAEPPPRWTPKPWNEFEPDPNFPQDWRRFVPLPLENALKKFKALVRREGA